MVLRDLLRMHEMKPLLAIMLLFSGCAPVVQGDPMKLIRKSDYTP